jgi:hypothetical protein
MHHLNLEHDDVEIFFFFLLLLLLLLLGITVWGGL